MESVLTKPKISAQHRIWSVAGIRASDVVALAYFVYVACLGLLRPLNARQRFILWAAAFALWGLVRLVRRSEKRWLSFILDWLSLSLILAGYWELEWFKAAPMEQLQGILVRWDRVMLNNLGLRSAIEASGAVVPAVLETVYLLLYTIPPACVAILYICGRRQDVDRFLFTLFLGTFIAYALLPHIRVHSPRIAFPAEDLPNFGGLARFLNTWLLDHLDISTSVFPSGHVAVAFSSACGLLTVLPQRRYIWSGFFLAASLVFIATIYGRYHYAADGLASVAIAFFAWRVGVRWSRHE